MLRILLISNLVFLTACQTFTQDADNAQKIKSSSLINLQPINPENRVIVIAHRGDWRNAPENSLEAIQNSINMGVDMVEIDIRLTKDSIPVLMHDKTIDRTTTGSGELKEWTLDSLKTLFLKNGVNHPTHHQVPTLEEAMRLAKGKIMINLDKCYDNFHHIYPILKKTNTTKQVLMKGRVSLDKVKRDFGPFLDSIAFMPVIILDHQDASVQVAEYLNDLVPPPAIEFVFSDLKSPILGQFKSIHKKGTSVWVNSLWETLNAGYEDDMAVTHTDSIYGWYIENNVNMIQTDRPLLLLEYLRSEGLHK